VGSVMEAVKPLNVRERVKDILGISKASGLD